VRCLYCGKGIGPIRQLRDLEFCSDAHRQEFRNRFRQRVFEALAPDPEPSRLADFRERRPPSAGTAPRPVRMTQPQPAPGERKPRVTSGAAGIQIARPGMLLGSEVTPAHPVWSGSTVSYRQAAPFAPRIPEFRPAALGGAEIVRPDLTAEHPSRGAPVAPAPIATGNVSPYRLFIPESASRPTLELGAARISDLSPESPQAQLAATQHMPRRDASPKFRVSLPEPASVPSAESAGMRVPQFALPPAGTAAASHKLLVSVRSVFSRFSRSATIAPPRTPSVQQSLEAGPSQALAVAQISPPTTEAPRNTVLTARGLGSLEAALPGLPMAAGAKTIAPQVITGTSPRVPLLSPLVAVTGACPAVPDLEITFRAGEQIERATRRPLGLAPMSPCADLQPALSPVSPAWHAVRSELGRAERPLDRFAAPAGPGSGLMAAASPGVRQSAGNQSPRRDLRHATVVAATLAVPGLRQSVCDGVGMASLRVATPLRAASPPAGAPAWDASRAAPHDATLVPLPNVPLPKVECLPAPAGALAAPGRPWHPSAGRSVRACAVLWTMRLGRLTTPEFSAHPLRVKFNALLSMSGAYGREDTERVSRRSGLRAISGGRPNPGPRKMAWQLTAAAAAAVLLAGVLRLPTRPSAPAPGASRSLSVKQWMAAHALRDFADDFRGGLNQWKGGPAGGPKGWSYSADGFVHPGQMALFRPSVPLSDYRFEFMAQIENKSVDWVVRAHDPRNYYAVKFTVLEPGPRPMVAMVHYPVIDGNKGARVLTPLRMMVHANTPYRVTMDVKGNHYRAFVEGQEADFWTDDRLQSGGVGFFSETGERARVYWVKLESHGDWLGRICSLLSGSKSQEETTKEKQAMDYKRTGSDEALSGVEVAAGGANSAQEARISRVLSKAASLHLEGKIEEASHELARALDSGERHPALYFALGQLQYELQDYLPASQSYAQAALLQPLHPTAYFNTGVCLGRLERWDEAADAFKKAISNDPARLEAHLALGACMVQLGRHNEALDAYDRFLARHPDNDEALFGKAVALQKRDRTTEAVDLYRRILNRNPNSEEALSNLVSLSLSSQDYAQARKYAQHLAEVQPKSQIALEGLAGAAFAAGDHAAAATYSRQLAEVAPNVFENWFNLGVACHKAGDLGNAASAYARAAKVQPDSPQAHLNLGVALQEQGDLKGARAAYERALEIDPKLAGAHWNLGLVHEQAGDFAAAEKLYAEVPQNSPDADDAAFRIGHLRLQRADYPGSVQAFELCLQRRANWPEARLNLGIAHWRAGNKDAARNCFQELTYSGADSKEALRGLAALSLESNDYDKAFEIYRQLLDSGDRSPELLYNAGLICQKRGEAADAAVLYKEALKADPQFGEALLNLGHAHMTLGNQTEARSCWRKAVIAKPELAQRYFEPAQVS
jgi:tetratricopeptide (TPR) repeat protein